MASPRRGGSGRTRGAAGASRRVDHRTGTRDKVRTGDRPIAETYVAEPRP
ncbi:hypothetical protein YT1_0445 [Rhodococcus ruber]|nr:hypothetical protein YT1_0445 [Rhodococcus ruber]